MNTATKRQRRKVGVAGSFQNQMMGNNSTEPKVGEGATILSYSDRAAYEVISVSKDGNSCEIRKMNCEFIGNGYGDERYKYHSDPNGYTQTLEWNSRKGNWCTVSYSVEIIRALSKRLFNEYGYGWENYLPDGIKFSDVWDNNNNCYRLVKGVTKRYKNLHPVSVIFGVMSEYRDPHF
jgi:hypothetical protein